MTRLHISDIRAYVCQLYRSIFCNSAHRVSLVRYTDRDTFSFGTLMIRMLAGFANGLSAVCDMLITVALCYYLHSKRTGFRKNVFL